ncbi:MAG TPA: hypothetical protein VK824_11630 [Planctomycetota bacterium]|nr:hypothetical protein [Planctomycetota bacterium]
MIADERPFAAAAALAALAVTALLGVAACLWIEGIASRIWCLALLAGVVANIVGGWRLVGGARPGHGLVVHSARAHACWAFALACFAGLAFPDAAPGHAALARSLLLLAAFAGAVAGGLLERRSTLSGSLLAGTWWALTRRLPWVE